MHCGNKFLFIAVLICVGAVLVSLSREDLPTGSIADSTPAFYLRKREEEWGRIACPSSRTG